MAPSLAHAGFIGLGAYSSIWASEKLGSFWLGLIATVVICAAVSAVTHRIALAFERVLLRHRHARVRQDRPRRVPTMDRVRWFVRTDVRRSGSSLLGVTSALPATLWLLLAVTGVAQLLVILIERSPLRRTAIVSHRNQAIVPTLGVSLVHVRVVLFVVGVVYAGWPAPCTRRWQLFIGPEAFSVELSIGIFLILMLGARGQRGGRYSAQRSTSGRRSGCAASSSGRASSTARS